MTLYVLSETVEEEMLEVPERAVGLGTVEGPLKGPVVTRETAAVELLSTIEV